ncbi:receptor-like serine/threonine-protein kinase ALE2 isoform X2 [Rutidosis leptorrhynchoides]|uniref:receptor-like serine/threonine-protein kinase ALE2 isoform X2 n=1 Tax=Rutidosis leptorrhynchoides TaxID=125765 RepID=UPI003A9A3087
MGFQMILSLITFLILIVCDDSLVVGSADHGVPRALTPTSDRSFPPDRSVKHFPSNHHATKWMKRGFPGISFHKYHHERTKLGHFAPRPSYQVQRPTYNPKGSSISAPAPSPIDPTSRLGPAISPSSYSLTKNTADPPTAVFALPPPPPNEDCTTVTCTQPLTYTPAGSPCACVWPIEVKLRLVISPYTFFPLVSELANEIATSVSLNVSQARIMGANAAGEQLDETIVLLNLVPLQQNFDSFTAFTIYQKFWNKKVFINPAQFGSYRVVDVRYPGLPPSPPSIPSNNDVTVDQPNFVNDNKGQPLKPFGVDIPKNGRDNNSKPDKSIVAVVSLSSVTAFIVFIGAFWLLLWKCGCCSTSSQSENHDQTRTTARGKLPGTGDSLIVGSRKSSESMSFSSSLAAYTGTAKIYSLSEIEKATDHFNSQRILGEGGFGVVYSGVLEDERKVAVKVLKRYDRQGGREFLAEVEMLSRLHHRNLVKLFGICTDDQFRCLVYELVPNGSVESHLHGADKINRLSWCARMKIALGAARGLAYLHEDSSPRVIHRDFKSSNILLENDFTPKVSDFGLAKTALDGHKHISTHVMGTFGYLAPEYAMTGHLLVKSDVYSYGVVLLELLTGRKPVDLLQPPGQENLVAWARPMLTNKEALESIIDPEIMMSNTPFDSILKVAAITSMCVQPEVSHRPFMGEVVQALKLVCNEFDEIRETTSRSCSLDEDLDFEMMDQSEIHHRMSSGYEYDTHVGLSTRDLSTIENEGGLESDSFRRQFNSAPLKMGKKKKFWQRLRGLSRGSMSDHEHEHGHGFSSNL